jgi:ribosomal protein S4
MWLRSVLSKKSQKDRTLKVYKEKKKAFLKNKKRFFIKYKFSMKNKLKRTSRYRRKKPFFRLARTKKYKSFFLTKKFFQLSKLRSNKLFSMILQFKKAIRFSYGYMKNKKLLFFYNKSFKHRDKYKLNNFVSFLNTSLFHLVSKIFWVFSMRQAKRVIRFKYILINAKKCTYPYYLINVGDLLSLDWRNFLWTSFYIRKRMRFQKLIFMNLAKFFHIRLRHFYIICVYKEYNLKINRSSKMYNFRKLRFIYNFLPAV